MSEDHSKQTQFVLSFCFIISAILWTGNVSAQMNLASSYSNITAKGPIPESFIKDVTDQIEASSQQNESEETDKKRIKELKEEFYVNSAISINNLYRSGQMLYGDAFTNYLNGIAKVIEENNPEIKDKYEVYTLKASFPNAFSTYEGVILVNIYLLNYVKSEAELAFLLCHEIGHILKKHTINQVTHKAELIKLRKKKKDLTSDDLLRLSFSRSKVHEFEADEIGFELFKKTPYYRKASIDFFKHLSYAEQPVEQAPFNLSLFETTEFKIPSCFLKEQLDTIRSSMNNKDIYSTHPNISSRIQAIKDLSNNDLDKGALFIQPESTFNQIKQMAAFEVIPLLLNSRRYTDALYWTDGLLKKYPSNTFLKMAMVKCLYGLTTYKNLNTYYAVSESYTDYGGQYQQVNYFFKNLTAKQTTALSLKAIYRLRNSLTEPKSIQYIDSTLVNIMSRAMIVGNFDYEQLREGTTKDIAAIMSEKQNEKAILQRYACKPFYKNALLKEFQEDAFKSLIKKAQKQYSEYKSFDDLSYKDEQKFWKELEKQRKSNGWNIKAKDIIVLEPIVHLRSSKKEIKTIENKQDYYQKIKESMAKYRKNNANLNLDYYGFDSFRESKSVSYYNELSKHKYWLQEWKNHLAKDIVPLANHTYDANPKYLVVMNLQKLPYEKYYACMVINLNNGKIIYAKKEDARVNPSIAADLLTETLDIIVQ